MSVESALVVDRLVLWGVVNEVEGVGCGECDEEPPVAWVCKAASAGVDLDFGRMVP